MKVALVVSGGRTNLMSAISSSLRVVEELNLKPDDLVILHTPNGKSNAEELRNLLGKTLGGKVEVREIKGDPESLKDRLRSIEEVKNVLKIEAALISSAGSSTSAIVSKAFNKILHVTFPYGPWNDLVFPYVPRIYQKVIGFEVTFPDQMKNVAPSFVKVKPPETFMRGSNIRWRISEVVSKINSNVKRRCNSNDCGKIKLSIEVGLKIRKKLIYGFGLDSKQKSCKEEEDNIKCKLVEIKMKLDNSDIVETDNQGRVEIRENFEYVESHLKSLKLGVNLNLEEFKSVIWTSGLTALEFEIIYHDGRVDDHLPRDKALILDSSAIFLGLLNYRHFGYNIKVPKCAIYELLHKYTESIKRARNKYDLSGLLAKVLADEVSSLKLEHPSPPDLCDKAFLQLDALILDNGILITGDKGIVDVWRRTPLIKLAPITKVQRKGKVRKDKLSNIVYYALQLVAIFDEINCLLEGDVVRVYSTVKVDDKLVHASPTQCGSSTSKNASKHMA